MANRPLINLAHPCNMKEFRIYVGMSEDHMIEVLHSGLRNDNVPENFPVRHVNSAGIYFPTRFIKIVPLSWVMYKFRPLDSYSSVIQCSSTKLQYIHLACFRAGNQEHGGR